MGLDSTHGDTAARERQVATPSMQLALLATLLAGSHALAPVIHKRPMTALHSDMIKGSIVGEDGITAEVAPQDDDLANPPQTMAQCLQQAQDATVAAIEDMVSEAHESVDDTHVSPLAFIGGFVLFVLVSAGLEGVLGQS